MGRELFITLPEELVEAVGERVAEILAEREQPAAEDAWLRGADRIAAYVDAPRSRVYSLAACKPPRIPVIKDGSALLAKRSELGRWLRDGGGVRP